MSNCSYPPGWPIDSDWTPLLASAFEDPDFVALQQFVDLERQASTVYPSADDVFNAFRLTGYGDVKAVILGQDPYHGPGQAHGLSFSVSEECRLPPSLRNIFKELQADLSADPPNHGNLESWARQGVLLLNTVMTVRDSEANSHRKRGWENFTDCVIRTLSQRERPVVFLLWGKPAQSKASLIADWHIVLKAPHPSPLSAYRGFFGSRPFSKTNTALTEIGQTPIDWTSIG
ncbi:uracil-DNA glycosylase [Mariniblastus sp.]|nr:uracil-DNA glycosylase [Mariniblastus sp.]